MLYEQRNRVQHFSFNDAGGTWNNKTYHFECPYQSRYKVRTLYSRICACFEHIHALFCALPGTSGMTHRSFEILDYAFVYFLSLRLCISVHLCTFVPKKQPLVPFQPSWDPIPPAWVHFFLSSPPPVLPCVVFSPLCSRVSPCHPHASPCVISPPLCSCVSFCLPCVTLRHFSAPVLPCAIFPPPVFTCGVSVRVPSEI